MLKPITKSNNGASEERITPHLALTHQAQGGPANGRKVSLLMKNAEELSPEVLEALQKVLKSQDPGAPSDIVKAASYRALERKLDDAVRKLVLEDDRWGWAYVRDFDDDTVIYSNYDGVYARSYTEDADGEIELADDVIEVNQMITYEDESGKLVLTESDSISSKVSGLVMKSFQKAHAHDDKLKDIFKTKQMEEKQMDENLKAANAKIDELTALVKSVTERAEAAEAGLAAVKQAEAVAKAAKRTELLKAVVAEGELEALQKSLEALDDTNFETVLKSMTAAKSASEAAGGMFGRVSKSADSGAVEAPAEDQRGTGGLIELLKAANPQ